MSRKKFFFAFLVLCIFFIFYWSNTAPTNFLTSYSTNTNTSSISKLETLSHLNFTGVNQYRNSVVKVCIHDEKNGDSYGTGFFISNNKIITTAHCLQIKNGVYIGNFTIQFSYQQTNGSTVYSKEYECQVDLFDPGKDIATGIVTDRWPLSISQPLNLSLEELSENQKIICCGFPDAKDFVSTTGTFSELEDVNIQDNFKNTRSLKNCPKFKIITKPGNSGSPLITDNNNVVGVVFGNNPIKNTASSISMVDIFFILN